MEISTKDLLDLTTHKSPFAGGAFGKLYKIEGNSEFAQMFNLTNDSVFKFHAYNFHNAKTLSAINDRIKTLKARLDSTLIQVARIKKLMSLNLKYSTVPSDIVYLEGLPIGILQNYIDGIDLINLGFTDMPTEEKKLIIDSLIDGQLELLENYIAKTDINCSNVMRLNNQANKKPIQFVDFDDIATSFMSDLSSEEYSTKCKLALYNIESMVQQYIEPEYEMPKAVFRNFK